MAERSKLTDPPITCRPSMGVGAAEGVSLGGIVHGIDPAKAIGAGLVRQMARETALVMVREQMRTLCRVMGLAYDEAALVCRLASIEFSEMHNDSVTPAG